MPPAARRAHAADADEADRPISRARYSTAPRCTGTIVDCELTSRSLASARARSIAAREIAGSSNAPTWMPQPPDRTIAARTAGAPAGDWVTWTKAGGGGARPVNAPVGVAGL